MAFINLKRIPDHRGEILHIAKKSELSINEINEVYASICYPGKYKAWHLHTKQTQNYVVVQGMIRIVLSKSIWAPSMVTEPEFETLYIGSSNYGRLEIPPGILNGYTATGVLPAIVINTTNMEHDPSEMLRFDLDKFNYDWFKNY
jgi:dTDP-4-dehydrorhamnose 3,5-epimerase